MFLGYLGKSNAVIHLTNSCLGQNMPTESSQDAIQNMPACPLLSTWEHRNPTASPSASMLDLAPSLADQTILLCLGF